METLQSFKIRTQHNIWPYSYNTAGESIPTFIKEKTHSSTVEFDVRHSNNNNMNVFFRHENISTPVGCVYSV